RIHSQDGRESPPPSPQPSALERGSLASRFSAGPKAPVPQADWKRCSLSPRERAGVRGNAAVIPEMWAAPRQQRRASFGMTQPLRSSRMLSFLFLVALFVSQVHSETQPP